MESGKRALIYFVLAGLCLLAIYLIRSNKPYTCYMCDQTKKGAHEKVIVLGVERDFCPDCFNRAKHSGLISTR